MLQKTFCFICSFPSGKYAVIENQGMKDKNWEMQKVMFSGG